MTVNTPLKYSTHVYKWYRWRAWLAGRKGNIIGQAFFEDWAERELTQ